MNSTNRILNRVVLCLAGLVLAVIGGVLVMISVWPDAISRVLPGWDDSVSDARAAVSAVVSDPQNTAVPPGLVAWGVAGILGVLALLIWFLATRGGGRTSTVARAAEVGGVTAVDRSVAAEVIGDAMRDCPGVISVQIGAFRVRREPALLLRATTQRGAVLSEVVTAAETAAAEWDALVGASMPVVLHLAGPGVWHRWRSAVRVR
ncbi:hypothetical protein FM113_10120 [Leucobacter sp. 7(1)]|uniref:hypothetical protein n=1 Tax=Leucobacter sp. 7(1) TaxID=1255613 RepID=UPI00097E80E7|nr:hypothetical protein [Leucobacter sp. 7(1)]SJN10791.1 hypothetical protein FM113_10120 [Leucobacter sp. 7(1)]